MDLAIDHNRAGFDLRFDPGVLTDGEATGRLDFTVNLAVNDQGILKFDRTFDVDIGGQNVANSGRRTDGSTGGSAQRR